MKNFKPMLAGKAPEDLSTLRYPVLVSPKLDGVRCVIIDGVAMSRKLKPIPNKHIQSMLTCWGREGNDGELMLATGGGFNEVQSAVMREDGKPEFVYQVFDIACANLPFRARFAQVEQSMALRGVPFMQAVPHYRCDDHETLLRYEAAFLRDGFEGLMIRSLDGPYKCGRSTTREGFLLKLKRFEDAEATIIGTEELMHNDNEATTDALGHTKRSSAKAGKRSGGTLGKLVVRRPDGVEFEIGTGFTAEMRATLWDVRETLPGLFVKYKFQPDPAAPQNKPRFPVFLGFRDERDMD